MSEKCPGCGVEIEMHPVPNITGGVTMVPDLAGTQQFHSDADCLRNQLAQLKETHLQACSAIEEQLAHRDATIARVYRQCNDCGCLVHGTPDHPCDKCGSLKGTGIEVAWATLQAELEKLRAVVEKVLDYDHHFTQATSTASPYAASRRRNGGVGISTARLGKTTMSIAARPASGFWRRRRTMAEDEYYPLRCNLAAMAGCHPDDLPDSLLEYAIEHARMVEDVMGILSSRQVLACIVMRWKEKEAQ